MRAKLVNEAIKHLTPKTEEELAKSGSGIFRLFYKLRKDLPLLEDLIEKRLGFRPTLKANLISNSRQEYLEITSENLTEFLGDTLVKTIFKQINIYITGQYSVEDNGIWLNPKLSYSHPSGGSNGTNFLWNSLWYKDGKWIEGDLIIK